MLKLFGFYAPLIYGEIKQMVHCAIAILHGQAHHSYIVYNDKIGYKVNDHINTDSASYSAMFAHYFEHERGNISKVSLSTAKSISLTNGSFSFAEIPVSFNNIIVGVTGTLIGLTQQEKKILQDIYDINKYTYIPSIFKQTKLKENKVSLYSQAKFASELVIQIQVGRTVSKEKQHRPVLVFFKDDKVLKEFYNSKEFDGLRNETLILNEELTHDEKMKLIKDACRLNTITLATRIFGRGTDFQVIDERVNKIGGTHVIQTFFSIDISEEVQIKGRTARHGDPGSFSMALNFQDVCKDFDIVDPKEQQQMKNAKDVHQFLAERRQEKMKKTNAISLKKVESAKKQHNRAYQLQQALTQNNKQEILKLLLQIN